MILAVDGGNSKTDLALVEPDGGLIARARGPLSSPHHVGLDGCLEPSLIQRKSSSRRVCARWSGVKSRRVRSRS